MDACTACNGSGRDGSDECRPCRGSGIALHWVSPSQLNTWDLCQRKWWYYQCSGIEVAQHPSSELGGKVHHVLQRAGDGVEIDTTIAEGAIAIKALPFVRFDVPHWREVHLYRAIDTVHGLHGIIDLYYPSNTLMNWGVLYSVPQICDYKTSSNPQRYGLDKQSLYRDTQANVYQWLTGEPISVMRWLYLPTKSGKGYPVETQITAEASNAHVARALPHLEAMRHYRQCSSAEDVPGNPSACGAYGGCRYLSHCSIGAGGGVAVFLSKGRHQLAIKQETAVMAIDHNILAQIRAQVQQNPAGQQPPPMQPAMPQQPMPQPQLQVPQLPQQPQPQPMPQPQLQVPQLPQQPPVQYQQAPPQPPAMGNGQDIQVEPYTLYIDCVPLKSEDIIPAEEVVSRAWKLAAEQFQVPHYRMAEFGQGPAMLHMALKQVLAAWKFNGYSILAFTGSPLVEDALPILRQYATAVVQGV